MNTNFLRTILFIAVLTIFAACDKDYNNVGADIIGDDHYGMERELIPVTTTNEFTGPVQSNNLDINAFGIYDNPKFGKTTANFVTQVQLASVNPTIDPLLFLSIESVELYIPYTATITTANTTGNIYKLEDTYGDLTKKMKLSIYENKYFMSDLDLSNNNEQTRFYSNQKSDIESLITGNARLNEDLTTPANIPVSHNNEFKFSAEPYSDGATTPVYTAPGMKINLNKDYFKTKILNAQKINLQTNAEFKDYFKGLYFKIEEIPAENGSAMTLMNFKKGTITIKYKEKTSSTVATPVDKSIILNLTGNTVNLLNNDFTNSGQTYNNTPNTERIYLRGGDGKYLTINEIIDTKFQTIKANKYIINEANLVFNIDTDATTGMGTTVPEPNRIYAFDVNNKRPLIDYYFDGTTSTYTNFGKYIFGGIIDPAPIPTAVRGTKYKIRITNYLRNIINNDSTNVKIGVAVCQNYAFVSMAKRKNAAFFVPNSSVMNPLGTIIYGSNLLPSNPNYDKRLQLEIWYTKPD